MKAPDWYNPKGGPAKARPLPPPLPPPGGRSTTPRQKGSVPALPPVPPAPQFAKVGAPPNALPPPPALKALPAPPPPPGAAPRGQPKGPAGSGAIALALADASKAAAVGGAKAGQAARGQLLLSRVKAAPPPSDEKPFEIWGLQNRRFNEDELDEAFLMMDLDQHGDIGPQDIRRVLDLCGDRDVRDEEVAEMIRLCDSDARGKVSFEEFSDFFTEPPAVFRNFDLHKREGPNVMRQERGSQSSEQSSVKTDQRAAAVQIIEGKKRLKPEFIKLVYQRFVELDEDERGFVSYEDFCFILRRAESEEMRRAFDAFDIERVGELDLRQFVVGLSMYTGSTAEDKLRFAFMMFDEEQIEEVGPTDLANLFKAMAPHLSENARHTHVQRLYSSMDLHPNTAIHLDEFLAYATEWSDELIPPTPTPSQVSHASRASSQGSQRMHQPAQPESAASSFASSDDGSSPRT